MLAAGRPAPQCRRRWRHVLAEFVAPPKALAGGRRSSADEDLHPEREAAEIVLVVDARHAARIVPERLRDRRKLRFSRRGKPLPEGHLCASQYLVALERLEHIVGAARVRRRLLVPVPSGAAASVRDEASQLCDAVSGVDFKRRDRDRRRIAERENLSFGHEDAMTDFPE